MLKNVTMADSKACKRCGLPVPADGPLGHCPHCLLNLGSALPPIALPELAEDLRLDDYEVIEELGRGAMGVVYRARQLSLHRMVAVKVLNPSSANIPAIAQRLRMEAEAAASLNHPHIVSIYDVGEHNGHPFFSMELIEGMALSRYLSPSGLSLESTPGAATAKRRGSQAVAAALLARIARAVDYAHKHGVLHRDLKPANVVIDAAGEPHLTDFGLAKLMGRERALATDSNSVMGTPAYMAPEQADGRTKEVSTAADIYGLGAILYAMLTGHPPFHANTPLETLRQVVDEEPRPPTSLNASVDRELAILCLKCLEKVPARRYSTAQALAEDLERWLRREPIEARPVRALGRAWRWCQREPMLAGMVGGLILLLATVALLASLNSNREEARRIAEERDSAHHLKALTDRIEKDGEEAGRVHLSAEEVAILMQRELFIDGDVSEQRITLGGVPGGLSHDLFLPFGELILHLRASLWDRSKLPVLFDLRLYKAHVDAKDELIKGRIHLLSADPAVYVLARQRKPNLTPLAQETCLGKPELRGAIFTRTESGITNLAGLKGRSFAFGKMESALGWYLPRLALAEAGLRSGDISITTNHSSADVLMGVRTGRFDAGVALWDQLSSLVQSGARLRVIHPLQSPTRLWIATADLDANTVAALREALLSLRDPKILGRLDYRLTGYIAPRMADYDALADQVEKAKQFEAQ